MFKKITFLSLTFLMVGLLGFPIAPAYAQERNRQPRNTNYRTVQMNTHNEQRNRMDERNTFNRVRRGNIERRDFDRHRFIFRGDRDFFSRHNFFRVYPRYNYNYFPGVVYPSTVVIVDINNPANQIIISSNRYGGYNTYGGYGYATNRMVVYVSDFDFYRILNVYNVDQNMDVYFNSYSNMITIYSRVGTITSGIQNMSIY